MEQHLDNGTWVGLRRCAGNQRLAAGLLGLPLRTLERKLRVLGVRRHDC